METSFGRLSRVLNCLQRTGRERRVAKVKYTPGRSSEIVHGFFLFLFLSFSFPPPPKPAGGRKIFQRLHGNYPAFAYCQDRSEEMSAG